MMRAFVTLLLIIFAALAVSILVFDLYAHFALNVPSLFSTTGTMLGKIKADLVSNISAAVGPGFLWQWLLGPLMSVPAFIVCAVFAALCALLRLGFAKKDRQTLSN